MWLGRAEVDALQLPAIQRLVDLPILQLLNRLLGIIQLHLGVLKLIVSTVTIFKYRDHLCVVVA